MSSTTASLSDYLAPGQLIPAEVNATIRRESARISRKPRPTGTTVNDLGHVNNYAVEPQTAPVAERTEEQKFQLGVLFALVTWVPVAIAVLVS